MNDNFGVCACTVHLEHREVVLEGYGSPCAIDILSHRLGQLNALDVETFIFQNTSILTQNSGAN